MKVIFEENPNKTTYYVGSIDGKSFTLIEEYDGNSDSYSTEIIVLDYDEDLTVEEHDAIMNEYNSKFN